MATYIYTYDGNKYHYQGYVKDINGNSIWEAHYPEFIEDEKSGEVMETSNIFDEGVHNPEDIEGVENYLKSIGVLNQNDELVDESGYMGEGEEDEEYQEQDYITNIRSIKIGFFRGNFGRNGALTWEIPESQRELLEPNYLILQSIDRDKDKYPNDLEILTYSQDSKGEGSKAIASLFKMYPSVKEIIFDVEDSKGFYDKIGAIKDSLKREDFFKYYNSKFLARGGRAAEYETYHKTLASALSEAKNFVENRGYEFSEETYFPDLTMGGVNYGQTISSKRDVVEVGGKNRKNTLVIVVYRMDSGTYELTMYFTKSNYADGGGVDYQYPTDLKVGSIVKGVGFPMLSGIDGGRFYKIVEMDNYSATLTRTDPSGKVSSPKKLRHKLSSLEGGIKTASRGDNNGIEVIKYADGGEIENENLEMLENQIVQIKHHAKEIGDIDNVEVDAWVIAKGQRAATDLSDITHYLDGKKAEEKMGYGGSLSKEFYVEFTFSGGDYDSRVVYIKADTKEEAEEKATKKFGKVYEGFKIIKIERSMKTGGKLETKSKNKLKATFELPLELVVYVPSTTTADKKISDEEFESRIDYVETYLSDLFGGYSATEVEGGYYSDEKGLIQEDVMKVTAFGQVDNFEDKFNQLLHQVKIWCEEWGQESIGFEFEGDLFYINKDSKFKDGGMMADGGYMAKGGGFNQYGEPYGFDRDEYNDMISEYDRLCAFYEDADSDGERARLNNKIDALEDKINAYERMEDGGETDEYAKGGNIPSIERRVAEVNAMIEDANKKGLEVVDEGQTWQAPMKYKPIKYTRGVLYISYEQLDLYKYNKGYGTVWEKKNDRLGRNEIMYSQSQGLSDIARMYRKALKRYDTYGYKDGGETDDYAKGGEVRYKLKGNNFGQQIESGQKFGALILKAFENQSGEQKYPENFIEEIAYTGKIVKNEGSNFLKDYSYKGTLTKFEFLDDKDFVEALKYLDRPLIKSFKFAKGGVTFDEKVSSISKSLLKRKKVSPSVQKDYGETYNKKEAIDSAKRIAGKIRANEISKKKD